MPAHTRDASVYSCTSESESPKPPPTESHPAPSAPYIENRFGRSGFNLRPDWGLYSNYFFADESRATDERRYLGTRNADRGLPQVDISYKEGTINTPARSESRSCRRRHLPARADALHHAHRELITTVISTGTPLTVDLSREYWNQSCNENLSLYGKQYYAVSDYMIADPNAFFQQGAD